MQFSARLRLKSPLLPILVGVLLVLKLLDPFTGWTLLLVGLGGAWLLAWLWARSLQRGLRLKREVRFGWIQVGDVLEERFTLTNAGVFPALWAEVIDHSTIPGYFNSSATGVGGHAQTQWEAQAVCSQRGIFRQGPTSLHSADPFGIYWVEIEDPRSTNLLVMPPVLSLAHLEHTSGDWSGEGRPQQDTLEKAVSSSMVRPYVPGEPLRWVHWPTTARSAQMYVRQFDSIPPGDWLILLDLDAAVQAGSEQASTLEHAVILAASLAVHGLQLGKAVGLAINGAELGWLAPRQGEGQHWEVLRRLAVAQAGERPLRACISQLPHGLGRHAGLLVITPSQQNDWIEALLPLAWHGPGLPGRAPLVLSLDPTEYAAGTAGAAVPAGAAKVAGAVEAPAAAPVTGQDLFVRLGVRRRPIPRAIFESPEARPGRRGQRRWRVTPSGRAVLLDGDERQDWKALS